MRESSSSARTMSFMRTALLSMRPTTLAALLRQLRGAVGPQHLREQADVVHRGEQVVRHRHAEVLQLAVRALELGGALLHALFQPAGELADAVLVAAPLGDVAHHPGEALRPAVAGVFRLSEGLQPAHVAVGEQQALFGAVGRPLAAQAFDQGLPRRRRIVGMQQRDILLKTPAVAAGLQAEQPFRVAEPLHRVRRDIPHPARHVGGAVHELELL